MYVPAVLTSTTPVELAVSGVPEALTAITPGSVNPLQPKMFMFPSPLRVIIGDEVDVVVVAVVEAESVIMSGVAALAFPEASVATNRRVLVLEAVSGTETEKFPDPLAVVEAEALPPVTETVESASAVPETTTGEVVVE